MKTTNRFHRGGVRGSSGRRSLRGRCGPENFAIVRDDRSANDLVLQVNVVVILLADREQELRPVSTVLRSVMADLPW